MLRQVPDRSESFGISVDAAIPWWPAPSETTASYEIEIGRAGMARGLATYLQPYPPAMDLPRAASMLT